MLKRKPRIGEKLIYKTLERGVSSSGEILTVIGFNEKQKSIINVRGENGKESSFSWRGGVNKFYSLMNENDVKTIVPSSKKYNFITVEPEIKEVGIEINIEPNKTINQLCPKCWRPRRSVDIECPYCGIIYSKFKIRPKPPPIKEAPPVTRKKRITFPKISTRYEIEIVLFASAAILFVYSKVLGVLGIICAIAYSVRGKVPNERHLAADTDFSPSQEKPVQASPFLFLGENIPDLTFKIKSSSSEIDYTVNPKNQTCSCPDFVDYRSQYQYGDIQRFCKHLMKAFCRKKVFPFVPDYLQPLIVSAKERGKGAFKERLFCFDLNQSKILLAFNDYNAWRSVYTKDEKNEYSRFGYNVNENRWSYDEIPENHREIISVIQTVKEKI